MGVRLTVCEVVNHFVDVPNKTNFLRPRHSITYQNKSISYLVSLDKVSKTNLKIRKVHKNF